MNSKLLEKVKVLEDALKCNVCKKTLVDPFLVIKCGHTSCKQCIAGHSCPVNPVERKDSFEDKQITDLLSHMNTLKELLQPETAKKVTKGSVCSTPKVAKNTTPIESYFKPQNKLTNCNDGSKTPALKPQNKRLSNKKSPNTTSASPVGNLNKKNHKGETLLHRAVIKGDIAKVGDLIKEGAAVNTQDYNGWTPLHEATNRGFVELARLLLDEGSLVNVPSFKDHITPLHDAMLNNQMAVAILLVSRGADLQAKTSFGYTALDLCRSEEDKKLLMDACSPFIQTNTLITNAKASPIASEKVVFLSSNLIEEQKSKLQKCAQMLKATIVEEFCPEVTHVVTCCDKEGNCTRTLKILMGMLSGKWLINYQWIEVCLEYKQKVDEEVFEVQGNKNQPNNQGPKRARLNAQQKFPSLFDGLNFYLHGTFTSPTPAREDLCNLIHLGGGKLMSREPRTPPSDTTPIPFHATGTCLERVTDIVLYQDKPKDIYSDVIATTQVMWLIACIAEFKLLPLLPRS